MPNSLFTIITTIQLPTPAVREMARVAAPHGPLVIVGDSKGPASYDLAGVRFLSLDAQRASPFEIARKLPTGHYARKNVGYLAAFDAGAELIYETDDDNAPNARWSLRSETTHARPVRQRGWVNAYRAFTAERIWPRGFPLDHVLSSVNGSLDAGDLVTVRAPIQQGLADNSPDVDAVWRLTLDRPFEFESGDSLQLPAGAWCPFNSQSTWWWPDAFPLMYLPSFCSFRMTDIWRSFIAQRCLWAMGCGVVFHSAEVIQDRNQHNLMRDFADETVGYLRNREFAQILEGLPLHEGSDTAGVNLRQCYGALVERHFFPRTELDLVDCWLSDVAAVAGAVKP